MAAGTVTVALADDVGDLTGNYPLVANTGIAIPAGTIPLMECAANDPLNIVLSAAVQVEGGVVYEVV